MCVLFCALRENPVERVCMFVLVSIFNAEVIAYIFCHGSLRLPLLIMLKEACSLV